MAAHDGGTFPHPSDTALAHVHAAAEKLRLGASRRQEMLWGRRGQVPGALGTGASMVRQLDLPARAVPLARRSGAPEPTRDHRKKFPHKDVRQLPEDIAGNGFADR